MTSAVSFRAIALFGMCVVICGTLFVEIGWYASCAFGFCMFGFARPFFVVEFAFRNVCV